MLRRVPGEDGLRLRRWLDVSRRDGLRVVDDARVRMGSSRPDELIATLLSRELLREMAGHAVTRSHLAQLGRLGDAPLRIAERAAQPAARVEAAARRRIGRGRAVATEDHALAPGFDLRVGNRDGADQ